MPKRQNPFGDASPLQFKSHIGTKEVDMGVNREENMQRVYAKTKELLFEGSKKAETSPCKQPPESIDIDSPQVPQILPGQLRLDSEGHLCAKEISTNGHDAAANGETAAAALIGRQDETMETEASPPAELESNSLSNSGLLPGQLRIDPEGHLCSGMKVQSISRQGMSRTLGFRICQSCNRPSNVGARPCNFCDKLTCSTCLRPCNNCSGLFCQICSTINYDENFERAFCLQCCDI